MLLLRNFNRRFSVIRVEQFGNPRIASLTNLELPRGSIMHYIPTEGVSEVGPPQTHPVIEKAEKMVQVNHVLTMSNHGTIGRPRRIEAGINRDVAHYHRLNKRLRMMHNTKLVERDDRVLMVENYAPLRRLYRYPETMMSWYDRWHNLHLSVVEQLGHDASKFQRQNYVFLTVPSRLPSISKLRRAEKRRDLNTLDTMRDDNVLFFLDLWTWFGPNRSHSMMHLLTPEQLKRINIIITYNDRFINLNLGELEFWRKGNGRGRIDPVQMQRRLYKSIVMLATEQVTSDEDETDDLADVVIRDSGEFESPELTPADDKSVEEEIVAFEEEDSLDEEEDFEIIKEADEGEKEDVKQTTITIDTGIKRECARYIEAGQLTTKEYQRILDQSDNYKTIPNPFGEGTLADMLDVSPEEVKVTEEQLVDDPMILDPGMAKSTTTNMHREYINKVLPKDICSSIVSVQRAGIAVNDYKTEEVVDAANGMIYHTLKLTPVKGESSTLHFPTPLFDDEGYWTANDVRYTLRRGRRDKPIRKTAPDTVSLTTFYNKNFVRRSDKVVNDWPKWLTNNIVSAGIDATNLTVSDLRFANVFDPSVTLPRDYTSVAQRLSGFTSQGIAFTFDYSKVADTFGPDRVAELKEKHLVPVGKGRNATYVMDPFNMVYKDDAKGLTEMGTLAEILQLDTSKAPKEHTELSLMGKAIPVGLILSYYYGLGPALDEFGVEYRIAEPGERVKAEEGDLILPCRDGKYVINFTNQEQALVFNGLRHYNKLMRDFSVEDFNRRDVYLNLIQKDGLTVRYLNELDLMETMYVDPISERLLRKMGEPTDFKGLLRRSNELLTTDEHPHETDMDHMIILGHQRVAGAVYSQLVKAIRDSNNKPGGRKKIILPPNQIWSAISQDPAVMPASDSNPIQSIKEADVVTFGGTGGRSRRSMVKRTRMFGKNSLGVISGDNVDSGDVGITEYMTNNPIFDDLDGSVKPLDRDNLEVNQYLSFSNQLAPGVMHDDGKRASFIGIQHGSGMSADGYEVTGFRTGAEKLVAHRTGSSQAVTALEEGKVVEMDEFGITVEYNTKPKSTKSYPIGKTFGRHEGGVFPHHLVSNVKVGQKFAKGDVLTYNEKFFEPDPVTPNQVNWKAGVMANVVLLEGTDTLEDSSAISPDLSKKLTTQISKVKNITVRFDQAIHDVVKEGKTLTPDTVLCVIEDAVSAGMQGFSDKSVETLRKLAAKAPRAKINGVVDRIEIFYHGDHEDMSDSVRQLVEWGDRKRKREAKRSPKRLAETGRIDSSLRIDGNPVELETMVIRLYLTQDVEAIGGDKAVFANQLKSTFRRVMVGRNETEFGLPIDAIFGRKSVDARIVLSVYQIGTTNKICQLLSERAQAILNGKSA